MGVLRRVVISLPGIIMPIKPPPTHPKKNINGKIDPLKYVLQGSLLNKKEKKRQKRHSEIGLSGVPPIMPIKTYNKKTQRAK